MKRRLRMKEIKLYNVLFPFWMLLLFPQVWMIVLPGNFLIDSLVLFLSMLALKIEDKKQFYKAHILMIYLLGLLADAIGSAYMFALMYFFEIGRMGDEWYLTVPALLISAVLIWVFNYTVTFRKTERALRAKMALIFAVITAPYTFLIPSGWLY